MTAIKFEFISKKEKNKTNNNKGIKAKGTCYFVINNEGFIISEIIQISKSEYRRTDSDMIKTKGYWNGKNKGPNVQKFRNKFLPENEIDSLNKYSARAILSEISIEKINKEFLKINQTALTALSLLSGSNITGSETNRANTPFYYDGSNDNYKNYNFFNFAKNIRIRGKKFSLNSIDDIDDIDDLIEIDTYFSRFPNITFKKEEKNTKELFEKSKII